MTVTIRREGTVLIAEVDGAIDTNTAMQFEREVFENLQDVDKLILDFAKVRYVASSGLRAILRFMKKMDERDGKMVIRNVGDVVLETLEITGILDDLDIE